MKVGLCTVFGVVGGCITNLFGGWDAGLITLVICMSIDYISGLSVAGIFHKSKKSEHGALESRAGFKGLCRKSMILFFILISYRLDLMIGSNYIRDAVIIGFVVNELISIIENATLMDLPIPAVLKKAVDGLKREEE